MTRLCWICRDVEITAPDLVCEHCDVFAGRESH